MALQAQRRLAGGQACIHRQQQAGAGGKLGQGLVEVAGRNLVQALLLAGRFSLNRRCQGTECSAEQAAEQSGADRQAQGGRAGWQQVRHPEGSFENAYWLALMTNPNERRKPTKVSAINFAKADGRRVNAP
ncbi:hypothetical protein D3C85_1410740 [compost metagenome]